MSIQIEERIPQYPMVRFELPPNCSWDDYPFEPDDAFILLGETKNMPGHCIVSRFPDGQIFINYHTENFIEIPEDDL